ncbi:MAG: hypothetical protein ACREXP_28870 [Steroidobacteraceae bacterium]
MTGPLMLIALFALGAALGWWLKRRTAATRKRVLQIALLSHAAGRKFLP